MLVARSTQSHVRRIYERHTSQRIHHIRSAARVARVAAVRRALEQKGKGLITLQPASGLFERREAKTHGPWSGEVSSKLELETDVQRGLEADGGEEFGSMLRKEGDRVSPRGYAGT